MSFKMPIFRFLGQRSITIRFGIGVGMLLALIVAVAVTGYFSLFIVHKAEYDIQISTEIQRMVLEMDRGMERARHLHANFFLQYGVIGLSAAHEQYAQPSVRQIAQVITTSNALKNLIRQSTVSEALRKSNVDLNFYLSSAKRFADTSIESVELVTELATPNRGLEAQLDHHFKALEKIVLSNTLLSLFKQMQSHVQNYRINRKRSFMQSAFNTGFQIRETVSGDSILSAFQKSVIEKFLNEFTTTAEKILEVDGAIKSKFNDFALQAEAVAPISTTLINLAGEEVRQARQRIQQANKRALISMIAMPMAGLILAGSIAWILNSSITLRVVRLTALASQLSSGNLDVFIDEHRGDEIGELARSLNLMAARIKELVVNLELKVAERTAELVQSERRFRDLFEHSSSGVAVYEPTKDGRDFIFKDINKAVENIEQVHREQVIGRRVTDIFPGIDHCGLLTVFQKVVQTGQSTHHPATFYADGRIKGWRENWVYQLPSGEIVSVYNDLTGQKQAETEKKTMEAKLQQARKMEAIGVLAGGIAHDFNNILSIILGNTELAMDDLSQWHSVTHNLNEIRAASLRAKDVIGQLLSFSRGSELSMKPIPIISIIKESLSLMRSSIPKNIEIQQNFPQMCSTIVSDPSHIHQVIINLCTNAAHAMEEKGGILKVTVADIQINEKNEVLYSDLKPGSYVQLTISDTGCGITPEIKHKIFDPYFTTKDIGRGSGMGLAVVHGIVKDHGGMISVYSEPGKGSTFNIFLPAVAKSADIETPAPKEMPGGREKILVVDDESSLVRMVQTALERLGYQVESTTDASAAVRLFNARPHDFDLIITDMAMPKITGVQLSKEIFKIRADMPIILCSGYSESIDPEKAKALGISKYLEKPVKIHELATAIRQVLEKMSN